MNHLFMTLYEHCNNAYIQLIAFDPQLLITVSTALTPLQTVRYMKHTCTLSKYHILAAVLGAPSNLGLILEHITNFSGIRTLSIRLKSSVIRFSISVYKRRMKKFHPLTLPCNSYIDLMAHLNKA